MKKENENTFNNVGGTGEADDQIGQEIIERLM